MTSAPVLHADPAGGERVRLKLKPKSPDTTGFVDGAWWPRSRDLSGELPALLDVLAVRLGQVERVSFRMSDWDPAPRRIHVDGTVHLDGFRAGRAGTVTVVARAQRLTLLVVPPDTTDEAAHRSLTAAGHRGNADTIADLLTSPTAPVDAGSPA